MHKNILICQIELVLIGVGFVPSTISDVESVESIDHGTFTFYPLDNSTIDHTNSKYQL